MATSDHDPKSEAHATKQRHVAFDTQTSEDLGFDDIRERLADHCKTESAMRRARDLAPSTHRPAVVDALESTDELRRIRVEGHAFPTLIFEEIKCG